MEQGQEMPRANLGAPGDDDMAMREVFRFTLFSVLVQVTDRRRVVHRACGQWSGQKPPRTCRPAAQVLGRMTSLFGTVRETASQH